MGRALLWALGLSCFLTLPIWAQACDPDGFLQKSQQLLNSGAFDAALEQTELGLQCDSTNVDLLLSASTVFRNKHKERSALSVAEKVLAIVNQANLEAYRPKALLLLTEIHLLRRDSQEATRYLQQLQEWYSRVTPNEAIQAKLNYLEGLAQFSIYGRSAEGLRRFQQTLKLYDALPESDVYTKGQILRKLGNYARHTGDFEQSLQYYDQELNWYLNHYPSDHPDVAVCHYNLGGVFYEMLEYQLALDHFLACFEVWKNSYQPGTRYYRFLTEAIGDMYWELGDRPQALAFYDLAVAGENPINRDSSQLMTRTADTLLQEQPEEALRFYQEALAFRERNFGRQHPLTAACQNYIGRAHLAAGNFKLALAAYEQSMGMLGQETLGLNTPTQLEALAGKGTALLQKALEAGNIPDLRSAFETLLKAIKSLEKLRSAPMTEASKLFWNRQSLPLLENTIQAAFLLYQGTQEAIYLEKAFIISEKSRSFLLQAGLQNDLAMEFAGVPLSLTTKEQGLSRQILDYENKIVLEERRCTEARAKQLDLWQEKLQSLQNEYNALINQLEEQYPQYFDLKYRIQTIDVSKLQVALGQRNAGLLEFFEGEQNIYIFYVDGQQLKGFQLAKDTAYLKHTQGLATLLLDQNQFLNTPAESYQAYTESAYSLYQQLLAQPLTHCSPEIRRLLIVPDQQLARIPFASLLTEPASQPERNYQALPYLLKRFALFYAPSAAIWQQSTQAEKKRNYRHSYVGFAPDYEGVIYPNKRSPPSLEFAREEVRNAQSIFRGKIYTGQEATELAFKRESARILHLAAHAYPDAVHPLLSHLLLVPTDSSEDGMLYAYEIYGERLNTQLTLLSACHTGVGQFEKGEGMISLERAFQYAGCPSLFSALWAVDDGAASKVTTLFLEQLKLGQTKDLALQAAQMQFLLEADPALSIPFYWSGFRLSGNMEPIRQGSFYGWHWLLISGLVLLAGGLVWRRLAYSSN